MSLATRADDDLGCGGQAITSRRSSSLGLAGLPTSRSPWARGKGKSVASIDAARCTRSRVIHGGYARGKKEAKTLISLTLLRVGPERSGQGKYCRYDRGEGFGGN